MKAKGEVKKNKVEAKELKEREEEEGNGKELEKERPDTGVTQGSIQEEIPQLGVVQREVVQEGVAQDRVIQEGDQGKDTQGHHTYQEGPRNGGLSHGAPT